MIFRKCGTCTEVIAMLFNEYYGEYYASVADIISEAVAGTLTQLLKKPDL